VGRRDARSGRRREDPYDREARYGRAGASGYGGPPGNGGAPGAAAPNGAGRPQGYGRGDGYSRRAEGYGDGAGRPVGYNRPGGPGRPGGSPGTGGDGGFAAAADPRGQDPPAQRGRRRPGSARARGSQLGSDLRARLGLGNGAPDVADGRAGNSVPGRVDAQDRRSARDPRPGPAGGRRVPSGPRSGQAVTGAGGYGGAGRYGYGAPGYGAEGYGGVSGYRAPVGGRAATGLRERGTASFTDATRTHRLRRPGGHPDGGGAGDGWGGGPRMRRKGSWWRHWTWKKAIAVAAGAFAGMMLLLAAAVVYAYHKTQIPTAVSEVALQQSSTVYFSNGKTEVGTFTADGIDRQILASNQIPAVMKNAMVAAEDRHFYAEGGISLSGILRSAYEDIKGGSNLQGGSTLTEQFVKNYYTTIGTTSRTVSTKIKEIFVSIKLSREKSKDWIMTQYLNTVPFGDNAYGVAAAAQVYFGEPAMDLTIAQAAMLAAMPNQPGFFSPDPSAGAGYTALVARWHYVLTNMVRDGAITQQQADAQEFPKVVTENQLAAGWTGYKGYIMQAVENELHYTYGYSYTAIDSRGLKIVTTFNASLMNGLYQAVRTNLQQMRADGAPLPEYAHVGAILEKPGTGAILAMYGGPSYSASNCTKINCQWNMATENREQVGSSFKPYVLATAVSEGMDVQNSILNGIEPMCVPPDYTQAEQLQLSAATTNCPAPGFEVNIPGESSGPLGLGVAKAAAISSDPAFEDLVHRAGTVATVNMAKKFGVNIAPDASGLVNDEHEVGMALGIASLTVEEQATTFATLANDGVYVTPHVIAQITENGGNIPLKITHQEVLNQAQAADVDYALSFDTIYGTAFPNGVLNPFRPTIGKTGTTDNEQSAFFIGAIPQYSLAVGMFTNNQNGKGGESLSGLPSVNGQPPGDGGNWPATIWQSYMQDEFASLPVEQLPTPSYVGFTKWDQVPKQPRKPKPQRNPNPNPCPPGHRSGFGQCPGPNPRPSRPNPSPSLSSAPSPSPSGGPSPSPSPSGPSPSPPFGGGAALSSSAAAAAGLLAAEDPTATAVTLRPDTG
jgi:membrane peptidoglycan carboxypeptidase